MADVCLPVTPARASKRDGVPILSMAARGLHLAAAPTFAVMALLTHMAGGPDMLCAPAVSPFTGMVAMYLLMSAFHLAPWLRPIAKDKWTSTARCRCALIRRFFITGRNYRSDGLATAEIVRHISARAKEYEKDVKSEDAGTLIAYRAICVAGQGREN